ncbi:MAG: sulfatase-like hydrolase/transferase [Planctomycetaceae bacterium]|nr:sulfatase-like hydrolase/transferase [Planctomycetaceae bacterium]MCB9937302.1 sulfatase-like hydrolase/transferase [Planctomycetaceae bacterium]
MANGWHGLLTESQREGLYLTDRLANEAVALLEQTTDKTFFMYLSIHAVHTPIRGRADFVERNSKRPVGLRYTLILGFAHFVSRDAQAVGRRGMQGAPGALRPAAHFIHPNP